MVQEVSGRAPAGQALAVPAEPKVSALTGFDPSRYVQATEANVQIGTSVIADGGFTCLNAGDVRAVRADGVGDLYIECRCGRHAMDGQLDEGSDYIGLYVERDWRAALKTVFDGPALMALARGVTSGGFPATEAGMISWSDWLISQIEQAL